MGPTPYGYQSQARCLRELTEAAGDDEEAQRRAVEQAQERFPIGGRLYVDEDEAEVVRRIFELYTEERLGARRIALQLNEAGHRTRGGALWYGQTVGKILKDPKVAGWVTFDEESYNARVPSSKPIWKQARYEARHEPLVDPEVFEEAEAIRQDRGRAVPKAVRKPPQIYALTHVVTCAHGHPMRSKNSGGCGKPRYFCQPRFHHGPEPEQGGCDADSVEAAFAEKAVREVIGRLLGNPAQVKRVLDAALRREQVERRNPSGDTKVIQALGAEVERLEAALQRWLDMIEDAPAGSRQESLALDRVEQVQAKLSAAKLERDTAAGQVIALPIRLTERQVKDFLRGLVGKLNRSKKHFAELIALLVEHHGLEVSALDEEHVRVSLALSPAAVLGQTESSQQEAPRARLSATVTLQRKETAREWAARLNAKGGPLCACGCGERILVRPLHRAPSRGLPRFVAGHQKMWMTATVQELNAEGLLTVGQAAKAMGIGATTLRRMCDRGEVEVVYREWCGPEGMRCVSAAEVEQVKSGHSSA